MLSELSLMRSIFKFTNTRNGLTKKNNNLYNNKCNNKNQKNHKSRSLVNNLKMNNNGTNQKKQSLKHLLKKQKMDSKSANEVTLLFLYCFYYKISQKPIFLSFLII